MKQFLWVAIKEKINSVIVSVKVSPGSKKELFKKVTDAKYEISVKEPAERNMANNRVCELIAREFKIPRRRVMILTGHKNTKKLLEVKV